MAKKKASHRRSRPSMWGMLKGVLYTGAVAAPLYVGYQQLGGGAAGISGAIKGACFTDPKTGKFSVAHGAQIWGPVAALAVVDMVSSRVGLQRQISSGISRLLG